MKSYVEDYRIAVAKISFLETYGKRYSLVDNLDKTSMLVKDKENHDKKVCISILHRPKSLQTNYPLSIFYEKNRKNESNQNDYKDSESIEILSDEFKECFQKNLKVAFFDPDTFFNDEKKDQMKIIFSTIPGLTKSFEVMSDSGVIKIFENYLKRLDEGLLFKYYAKRINKIKKHNRGALSFCHPKYFNDPFDCNCSFSNGTDATNHFRTLCLTKEYNNILMWSHYGSEHKGYCYGYEFDDICKILFSSNFIYLGKKETISGLVVVGNVIYSAKRPNQRAKQFNFSWTDINHYINACFTKFKDWKYEKEVRFVIMSDQVMPDFLGINPKVIKKYRGCQSKAKKKLSKDPTRYALY